MHGLERCDHESVLPVLEPMLASTGTIAAPVDDWAFEPKLDGWRALVYVDNAVTVRTRTGRDVSVSLPELEPLAHVLRGRNPPHTQPRTTRRSPPTRDDGLLAFMW